MKIFNGFIKMSMIFNIFIDKIIFKDWSQLKVLLTKEK